MAVTSIAKDNVLTASSPTVESSVKKGFAFIVRKVLSLITI